MSALEELMAVLCGREIKNGDRFGVGVESPVPVVGAMLALALCAPHARVASRSMPGGPILFGSHEFSGLAQSGKVDLFFLSAAQIDREANINLQYIVVNGVRKPFLGPFAAPVYYSVIPRVVLFRAEHSPRVFVPRVDCVTAAGRAAPRERRAGGPSKIITSKAVLRVCRETGAIELQSFHAGETPASVQEATGFTLKIPGDVHETPPVTAAEAQALREHVYPQLGPKAVPWLAADEPKT